MSEERTEPVTLWARLRQALTPTVPPDPEQASLARTLTKLAIAIALIVTPLDLLLVLLVPATAERWLLLVLAVAGGSALLLLLARTGHPKAAARLFAVGSWFVMTAAAATGGGVEATSIIAQPVIPAIVAMLLGWQEGLIAAAVTVLTVFGLAWVQAAGRLPVPTFVHSPFVRAVEIASWVATTAALGVIVARNLHASRDRARSELRKRMVVQRRLSEMIDNAPFAAFGFELDEAGELVVMHSNRSADRILGVDATQFLGLKLGEAFPQLAKAGVDGEFLRVAKEGGTYEVPDLEYSGALFQGVLEIHAFQTGMRSVTVFFTDVTEKRKAEEQIRHMAYHDQLTELPNRKLFNDRLMIALANAERSQERVGLLFLDLDGFKPINDRFGHIFGDELLVAVADRLRSSARAGDTIARFGGDEFMVLLPQVPGIEQVEAVARKLLAVLAEPFEIQGTEVAVGASVGLSITVDGDRDAAGLLQRADHAMYRMKSEGRGGFRIWE